MHLVGPKTLKLGTPQFNHIFTARNEVVARWHGAFVAGGMHGGGHAWQGGIWWWGVCGGSGGVCVAGARAWQGVCVAGEMATAVGSTHPTGMHSC